MPKSRPRFASDWLDIGRFGVEKNHPPPGSLKQLHKLSWSHSSRSAHRLGWVFSSGINENEVEVASGGIHNDPPSVHLQPRWPSREFWRLCLQSAWPQERT